MALGWLALLKGVPWAGVIRTAPLVADGAKQLWKAVSKKPPLPEPPAPSTRPQPNAADASAIELLETRMATLETGVADLHAQMLKSSELIKVLADQNAILIQRVEANRVRTQWLTGLALVALLAALAGLAFVIIR